MLPVWEKAEATAQAQAKDGARSARSSGSILSLSLSRSLSLRIGAKPSPPGNSPRCWYGKRDASDQLWDLGLARPAGGGLHVSERARRNASHRRLLERAGRRRGAGDRRLRYALPWRRVQPRRGRGAGGQRPVGDPRPAAATHARRGLGDPAPQGRRGDQRHRQPQPVSVERIEAQPRFRRPGATGDHRGDREEGERAPAERRLGVPRQRRAVGLPGARGGSRQRLPRAVAASRRCRSDPRRPSGARRGPAVRHQRRLPRRHAARPPGSR